MTEHNYRVIAISNAVRSLSDEPWCGNFVQICKPQPGLHSVEDLILSSCWVSEGDSSQCRANRLHLLRCLIDGARYLRMPLEDTLGSLWDDISFGGTSDKSVKEFMPLEIRWYDVGEKWELLDLLPKPCILSGWNDFESEASRLSSRYPMKTSCSDSVASLVLLACHDAQARACLVSLGYLGVNYVSIYKCIESISDGHIDNIANQYPRSDRKDILNNLKRFKAAANAFEQVGPLSRHGLRKNEKSFDMLKDNVMGEAEAQRFCLPLIAQLLDDRAARL